MDRYFILTGCERFDLTGFYQHALQAGVPDGGTFVFSAVNIRGDCTDVRARLWPHTEWLKAALMMAHRDTDRRAAYETDALRAWQGLKAFLDHDVTGLWYDWRAPDGSFTHEPARASSMYHIVGAIEAMVAYQNCGDRT